jgi:hypothetical protein
MMSAMPNKFVNEVKYFIQNTLFEPTFERFCKLRRIEDIEFDSDLWRMDPLFYFCKKYAVINALETVHNFFKKLFQMPRQMLCVKLIRRKDYFFELGTIQCISNTATNITFKKREKMLLMYGMFKHLIIKLFFKREIFPLNSQLEQIYLKNFGEVMYESICRKMKAPKEVPRLELRKITASYFQKRCELASMKAFIPAADSS